jgi:hypothetical protein
MKKVTEFREIPRNFTELYNTEFSGIPRNFSQFRTELTEVKKQTEFRVDGIPWTPYSVSRANTM